MDVINEIGSIKKVLMGGAGAGAGSSKRRSEKDREYGRVHAGDEREGRAGGWPMAAATGLEGWLGFKQVVGLAAGFAGEAAKNGLRRAADVLEKR